MVDATKKGGKKNRKYGRSKRTPSYTAYHNAQRWLLNKIYKLLRQVRQFPTDLQAARRLKEMTDLHPTQERAARRRLAQARGASGVETG